MDRSKPQRDDPASRAPARAVPSERDEDRKPGKFDWIRERLEQHAVMRVLLSTADGFVRDEVTDHAAAMTYYGIFSLFPLILLFMAIGGIVLQNNDYVREQVVNLVVGLLPQGQDELRKMIVDVIKAKGAAAGIGILLLVWSALGWFQVIDKNVNQIWGVGKPRPFLKGKLFALAMVAAIGGVGLVSFGASAAIRLLAHYTDKIPGSAALWQVVVSGVSLLVIGLVFYLLYRYVPQRKLQFADIWPAALATAVLWELTRYGLAIYFEKNDLISGYGPIGAAMALLFWLYVASIIILIGAELSYSLAKERRHLGTEEEMEVVDKPGEQPSPKFAPQVGGEAPPAQGQGAR